ncbi:MAG: metallophosphoesterase [Clostridium sp.]|nr:metallophosphoesterase [Clostridium sp.]
MFKFLIIPIIILILLSVYIVFNFHKFNIVKNLENKNRALSWFVASIPILILIIIGLWYFMYSVVIIIHLSFLFFICRMIGALIRKVIKFNTKCYIAGIMAIVLTTCYFAYGWQVAHKVVETDYKVTSEKLSDDSLRIVQITDSHMGTTFSGKEFEKYIDEISECNPDVIVFTGDFVDGSTTYEDMVDACESLGKAKSKYGVYFIFGNHDLDVYGGNRYYSDEELLNELKKNNINVLQDENVLIDDKFYICGRQDATVRDRKSTEELLSEVDKSKFTLLLDHQPIEYKEAEENGADMLLSGHTHGGQLFPLAYINTAISRNDMVYGFEQKGNTSFIVSSGISEWGFGFRTGCKSEYVVIDVEGQREIAINN